MPTDEWPRPRCLVCNKAINSPLDAARHEFLKIGVPVYMHINCRPRAPASLLDHPYVFMADQQARSKLSGASGDMRRHIIDELARPVEDRGRDYALAGILLPIVLFWIGALPYQSDVLRFPIALVVALIPAPISFFYWRSMQTFANQIRKFVQTDSG